MNAKKTRLGKEDALKLAREGSEIYATKGKKVFHIDLEKNDPGDGELCKLLIGPTGNLRAPALKTGNTLIVGFHEETYQNIFK